ncbi:MAG: EamA family transporter [Myxococcota bacterium]|nr:EamA family transporter [Myxococcota bacterium]
MPTFVALCLFARFSYSLNDIFVGRLARRYGRVEVAAFRGVSLGLSMAPWLLLVPARAWGALLAHPLALLLTVAVTALGNLLHLHAARSIPFGLRGALMITSMAACSLLIGWGVLAERLSALQVGLCVVLVASGAGVALGTHADTAIEVDVPRGAAFTIAAGVVMAGAMTGVKFLARETHPLLAAWAWEFGAGAILAPALLRRRAPTSDPATTRFRRVALASLPTALASGASVLALDFGELGLWGALTGTQILFTAALGALWHHEALGRLRWALMTVAAAAVAALALVRN